MGSVTRKSDKVIRRVQRRLAIRVVRGYRTISHDTALALAGMVPFGILGPADAEAYKQIQALQRSVGSVTRAEKTQIREKKQQISRNRSKEILFKKKENSRAIATVLAHWDQWLDRGAGTLTFRVTQMITGHGCFGVYLHRIGAEETPACQECGAEVDSAQHVLGVCPRFQEQRQGTKRYYRKRYIPDSDHRGTRGRRKREDGHQQILRGGDGHEGDHREKPGNLRPGKTRKAACEN